MPPISAGVIAAGIGAAGSLTSGILSNQANAANAARANQASQEAQRDQFLYNQLSAQQAEGFSASQAQTQMDFQERMSSTSYQRATKDMEAAGLNPMLAYSQGGASTPSGAMATGIAPTVAPRQITVPQYNPVNVGNAAANAVSIDNEIKRGKLIDAQTTQTLSSAGHLDSLKEETNTNIAWLNRTLEDRVKQAGYSSTQAYYDKLTAEFKAGIAKSEDINSARYYGARAAEIIAQAKITGAHVSEAVRYAAMWDSEFGKNLPYAHAGADIAGEAAGAFASGALGLKALRNVPFQQGLRYNRAIR